MKERHQQYQHETCHLAHSFVFFGAQFYIYISSSTQQKSAKLLNFSALQGYCIECIPYQVSGNVAYEERKHNSLFSHQPRCILIQPMASLHTLHNHCVSACALKSGSCLVYFLILALCNYFFGVMCSDIKFVSSK